MFIFLFLNFDLEDPILIAFPALQFKDRLSDSVINLLFGPEFIFLQTS